MKRLQNKISESYLALPVTSAYAAGVWVFCGLFQEKWWIQFCCLALSTFLMEKLNNSNALIRIHSRMVSCSFLVLSCMASFLFPSLVNAICELFFIGALLFLFYSYKDKDSPGVTYYGFLLIGLASVGYVHILWLLPALWVLMFTNLQSLSWRTLMASLMGIITPYWFLLCWYFYQDYPEALVSHFEALGHFQMPFDFSSLSRHQMVTFFFVLALAILGSLHFWRSSYQDKIRIRMFFGFFIRADFFLIILFCLQPQHYDLLLRLMIVNTTPLIAHFIALTGKRVTNIMFCCMVVIALVITAYNIWI